MKIFSILLLGLAAMALFSCRSSGPAAGARADFIFRLKDDPPSLDPAHCTDYAAGVVCQEIFDGLVETENSRLTGAVADTFWSDQPGTAWTFKLRRDAVFHNGRTVTSADFVYAFTRVLNPRTASERSWVLLPIRGARDYQAGRAAAVAGLFAPDSFTLVITLEKPFTPFLHHLAMVAASAVPAGAVKPEDAAYFGSHPVGCGPYQFSGWQRGQEIRLTAFPPYFAGRPLPAIKEAAFQTIPQDHIAYELFKDHGLDFLPTLPAGQIKLIAESQPRAFHRWPIMEIRYLGINLQQEPFRSSRELRQALNYSLDRERLCNIIYEGAVFPAGGVLPPGLLDSGGHAQSYPYNPDRARRLIAAAGYGPVGRPLPPQTLLYNNKDVEHRMWQFVKSGLESVGFTIRLQSLEWSAFLAAVRAGEASLFRGSWVGDFADPHNFLYTMFHSRNQGAAGNYCRFSDPGVDSLLEAAETAPPGPARDRMYRAVEDRVVGEAAMGFLFYGGEAVLLNPAFGNGSWPAEGYWMIPLQKVYKF
jgi:peptide/nickel transport system substrate-binding protein/oligopeptide transport system substrate-binding protein